MPALMMAAATGSAAATASATNPITATGTVTAADSPALHTFGVIAAGAPNLDLVGNNEGGAVDLYLTDGSIQVLTEQKLGLIGEDQGSFDRFGSSIAVADLNGDGYSDLVVGAPGDPVDGSTPGHVDVLLGSADGITGKGATMLTSPARTGDEFGTAIAVSDGNIWIGAPGTDSGSTTDVGAVYRYSVAKSGAATLQGSSNEVTLGAKAALQAGERFGAVLAPSSDGVIVGVPDSNVGTVKAAGQIAQLHLSGDAVTADVWNQNSAGVPGTAEAGDHFGAAVIQQGGAVGVPGEDIGTLKDAGSVQFFGTDSDTNKLVPQKSETQDSTGVPGTVEAGDQFGAALAVGIFNCQEFGSVAIGAPGEDIGKIANAGSVTVVTAPDAEFPCPAVALSQGSGLPGKAETDDAVGQALGTLFGDSSLDEDRFDGLLIGSPGEDIGTSKNTRNVGRATLWLGGHTPAYAQSFGFQGGDVENLGYGSVFGSEG